MEKFIGRQEEKTQTIGMFLTTIQNFGSVEGVGKSVGDRLAKEKP